MPEEVLARAEENNGKRQPVRAADLGAVEMIRRRKVPRAGREAGERQRTVMACIRAVLLPADALDRPQIGKAGLATGTPP